MDLKHNISKFKYNALLTAAYKYSIREGIRGKDRLETPEEYEDYLIYKFLFRNVSLASDERLKAKFNSKEGKHNVGSESIDAYDLYYTFNRKELRNYIKGYWESEIKKGRVIQSGSIQYDMDKVLIAINDYLYPAN